MRGFVKSCLVLITTLLTSVRHVATLTGSDTMLVYGKATTIILDDLAVVLIEMFSKPAYILILSVLHRMFKNMYFQQTHT